MYISNKKCMNYVLLARLCLTTEGKVLYLLSTVIKSNKITLKSTNVNNYISDRKRICRLKWFNLRYFNRMYVFLGLSNVIHYQIF